MTRTFGLALALLLSPGLWLWLAPGWALAPISPGSGGALAAKAEPSCAISWSARPLSPAQRRFACELAQAAQERNLPVAALLAIWQRECSLDPVCPRHRSVDPLSFGPMQITRVAAEEHSCSLHWDTEPSVNAMCAARIVTDWRADPRTRGRWTLIFTMYHRPRDLVDFHGKPSGYGMQVYRLMLRRTL